MEQTKDKTRSFKPAAYSVKQLGTQHMEYLKNVFANKWRPGGLLYYLLFLSHLYTVQSSKNGSLRNAQTP